MFTALTRFLDLLDEADGGPQRAELDPLGLAFQLKLLWLAGYLPHVGSCAECGAAEPITGLLATGGRSGLRQLRERLAAPFRLTGWRRSTGCSACRSSDAREAGISERGARDALAVVSASYEFHGGFRLRTLSA